MRLGREVDRWRLLANLTAASAPQINARTQLAVRYNDVSPLENHHSAMTFDILSQKGCRLFSNFTAEAFKRVREAIIR